jgi:homoserine O-acetyltransferase
VRRRWFLAAGLLVAPSIAQELKFAELGDFQLESGEVIRDCRIGYRAFGTLDSRKSNAVLFPTWFTGTTQQLVGLIGPGKLVDSSRYFVVAVDALGDGVSSSPSNSKLQPRMKFPVFTIRDMVNSQRQLLENVLHLSHLRAVMGVSMGGMQTFQWMVSNPDFMDRAIPIVGTPKLTAYDLLLWQSELHAIKADHAWNNGEYQSIPEAGMRTVADIHALALETPAYRVRHTDPNDFQKFLAATEQETMSGFDSNNWVRQLEAMLGHDISKSFGGDMQRAAKAVKAHALVVVGLQDHMVNPQPALAFARLLQAPTLELDSECGHLVVNCDAAKVNAAVERFLAE